MPLTDVELAELRRYGNGEVCDNRDDHLGRNLVHLLNEHQVLLETISRLEEVVERYRDCLYRTGTPCLSVQDVLVKDGELG